MSGSVTSTRVRVIDARTVLVFEFRPRPQQLSRVGSLKHARAHHVGHAETIIDEPVTLGEHRLHPDSCLGEAIARRGVDEPLAEPANPAKQWRLELGDREQDRLVDESPLGRADGTDQSSVRVHIAQLPSPTSAKPERPPRRRKPPWPPHLPRGLRPAGRPAASSTVSGEQRTAATACQAQLIKADADARRSVLLWLTRSPRRGLLGG